MTYVVARLSTGARLRVSRRQRRELEARLRLRGAGPSERQETARDEALPTCVLRDVCGRRRGVASTERYDNVSQPHGYSILVCFS